MTFDERYANCDVSVLPGNVVVLHEHADNPGQSVTNSSEIIANALLQSHVSQLAPATIQWFEHYPPPHEEWDRITYTIQDTPRGKRLTQPDWSPSSLAEIERLSS